MTLIKLLKQCDAGMTGNVINVAKANADAMVQAGDAEYAKKKDEKKEPKPIHTSRIIEKGVLWEQIYDPETRTSQFAAFDEKTQSLVTLPKHHINGVDYYPIQDKLLENGAVLLPSGIMEYGSPTDLDVELNQYMYRYLDITGEHRQKAVWYVRLTHVLENINTIPYLRALGDYGTGKTRYEDVIGGVCYKPMFVGGSVHAAPIYRIIDLWHGTPIFDEFTLGKSDETEAIIQILNNGYQRGKPVIRCKADNVDQVLCFDPFGPKILACRKAFTDQALESRCITEILGETTRNDIPSDLGTTFRKERDLIQNMLLLYRFRTWDKINPEVTNSINFGPIMPRIKQTFLPFTVLFQYDPATLETFVEGVKAQNEKSVEENSSTFDGLLINSYLELQNDGYDSITAKILKDYLIHEHGADEKLNERTIGKHLSPLGFISKQQKIMGKNQRAISIHDATIKRLIMRYVPSENQAEYLASLDRPKPPKQERISDKVEMTPELQKQCKKIDEQGWDSEVVT